MRKKFIALLGVIVSLAFTFPWAKAFNGDTHRYVTERGLALVSEISEHKNNISSDDKKYFNIIGDYSLKPDEDEIEGAYKFHFYNPSTETNFMGEKKSALLKCTTHYNNALDYYKKNNKSMAFQELGRAIHFMEDMNTPVHVGYNLPTDAVFKLPLHVKFEKVCDSVNSNCKAEINNESLKYFEANSVSTIAKSSAILASGGYYRLDNDMSKKSDEELAKNAVLNAQYKVTGLLYKFFSQVSSF